MRRAEGNPFFVEEVLRSLQETGAVRTEGARLSVVPRLAEHVVPDTVQDVIRARIQRLPDAPRRLLELASVIGREFTRRLIDRVAEPPGGRRARAARAQGLRADPRDELFPELVYEFRHALTHDVAYAPSSPPGGESSTAPSRGRSRSCTGTGWPSSTRCSRTTSRRPRSGVKALDYLRKAAEKATQAFAIREALALYQRALEAAGRLGGPTSGRRHRHPPGPGGAVLRRERVRPIAGRGGAGRVPRPRGRRSGREGRALAAIGWAAMWARDLDGSVAHAREAIEIAGPGGGDTVARAQFTIGFVRAVTRRSRRGQERDPPRARDGPRQPRVDRPVTVAVRRWPPEELGGGVQGRLALQAKASRSPGSITCSSPSSSTSSSTGSR